ncbi:MAG: site-2 protease family protein [Nitrososphaerales archaeon]
MAFDLLDPNYSIVLLLIAWLVILGGAKALRLEKHGFEIKPFMLTYKNRNVSPTLDKMLSNKRAIKLFADVGIVGGALMMAFALWFLINNLSQFFIASEKFSEVTLLIPGVTVRSAPNLMYFLLAVPFVLVIHEVAHGIVARLEKIRVKSGGFAIIIAIIAGFVEPDEEDFGKAKKVSKVRVIAAGSTSNVLFSFVVAGLLMFNPMFGNIMELISPDMRSLFYNDPIGVPVIQITEGSGAEAAGMQANDIITSINGVPIKTPDDLGKIQLTPGERANVTVLRDGQTLNLIVLVSSAPDNPEKGLLGILRGAFPYLPPKSPYWIPWPAPVFTFLLWVWMLSFFIGIFNMLPMFPLDGEKYVSSALEQKISKRSLLATRIGINITAFSLLGGNIAATVIKSGFIVI